MDDSVTTKVPAAALGTRAPRYLILFFGALVALGPLSMDAYLPAMPAMAAAFGVSIVSLNNTLSVFLIGYAVGQFFGGSFSDQIGRKRIGYTGLILYILASLGVAFAQDVQQMLVLRFLQAVAGGFSTVICMATVRDVYPIEELGRRFAAITMIVLVAPLVAPVLGAFLLPFGWESIFVVKASYAAILLGLYTLLVPRQGMDIGGICRCVPSSTSVGTSSLARWANGGFRSGTHSRWRYRRVCSWFSLQMHRSSTWSTSELVRAAFRCCSA
jgi:MFS family permease